MPSNQMPVEIRNATAEDVAFVLNSWIKAHRESDECRHVDYALYHKHIRPIVVRILSRASVVMAVNPEDANHIYGYAVVEYTDEDTILHYAYTKYTFRRFGVCTQLLEFAIPKLRETPTFITFIGKQFPAVQTHFNLSYNPWMR